MFFPDCSSVIRGASSLVTGVPRLITSAPRLIAGTPGCTQSSLRRTRVFTNLSQSLPWYSCTSHQGSQLLRRPAGMPSHSLILFWNWCISVYTPHPLRHFWSLPETKIHFADVGAPITEQLTTSLAKNATGRGQNTYSKIINVADCKTSKKRSLAVKYLILIIFNYPTAKTSILYKSTDGPAGRPADNPPNLDKLGDLHRTVSEMTVRGYSQPGPTMWQKFGSDQDPDPKWRSGTVANTMYWHCI